MLSQGHTAIAQLERLLPRVPQAWTEGLCLDLCPPALAVVDNVDLAISSVAEGLPRVGIGDLRGELKQQQDACANRGPSILPCGDIRHQAVAPPL